jgi:hypothetical protein
MPPIPRIRNEQFLTAQAFAPASGFHCPPSSTRRTPTAKPASPGLKNRFGGKKIQRPEADIPFENREEKPRPPGSFHSAGRRVI